MAEPETVSSGNLTEMAREIMPPKKKRQYTDVPAPVSVDVADRETKLAAARAIIEQRRAEKATQMRHYVDDHLSYIECDDGDCRGPALWVWGNPARALGPKDWETAYKPRGMDWPSDKLPYCQCCHSTYGVRRPVRAFTFEDGTTGFIPNPRFVREASAEHRALFGAKE